MKFRLGYVFLCCAFLLMQTVSIAQDIAADSTKQKSARYFTGDFSATGLYRGYREHAWPVKDGYEIGYFNHNSIARQFRFMISQGRFKYGLGFYLQKIYTPGNFYSYAENKEVEFTDIREANHFGLTFGYYPIQKPRYALGVHLESMVPVGTFYYPLDKYKANDQIDFWWFLPLSFIPLKAELVEELRISDNISVLLSAGYLVNYIYSNDDSPVYGNEFYLDLGLRLNALPFQQERTRKDTVKKRRFAVSTGVSYGGAYVLRHFKDPDNIPGTSNYPWVIARLPVPVSFPLLEFSMTSKRLNGHALVFCYSKSLVKPNIWASSGTYVTSTAGLKTWNTHYQFDSGILKKKFNYYTGKRLYPYIGGRISTAIETFKYSYDRRNSFETNTLTSYLYKKEGLILSAQSVIGVRTHFDKIVFDTGISYSIYSTLRGNYNYLSYYKGVFPDDTYLIKLSDKYDRLEDLYFNDLFFKIGYIF